MNFNIRFKRIDQNSFFWRTKILDEELKGAFYCENFGRKELAHATETLIEFICRNFRQVTNSYYRHQLREILRFWNSVRCLAGLPFVEIDPDTITGTMTSQEFLSKFRYLEILFRNIFGMASLSKNRIPQRKDRIRLP